MTTICTFCGAQGHSAAQCGWRDDRASGDILLIRRDTLQALYDAALVDDEHGNDSIWELPEMAAARDVLSRPGLPKATVDSLLALHMIDFDGTAPNKELCYD